MTGDNFKVSEQSMRNVKTRQMIMEINGSQCQRTKQMERCQTTKNVL